MHEHTKLAFKEFHKEKSVTILFIHGGGVAGWMWQPVVDLLPEFHCLVPDLPEHGASAEVTPFGIELAAEKCAELIRGYTHGGRAVVVGLSEGAQVAVQMMAAAPEIISRAMISSALLLPVPGSRSYSSPRFLSTMYRLSMSAPFRNNWWISLNMKHSAGIPNHFFPQFRESFISTTRNQFVNLVVANQTFRLPQGVERFSAPTLIVYGKHEYKAMRESARLLARNLQDSQLFTVVLGKNSSLAREHNWALTAPKLFANTLSNWLHGG
jgi:pimeloyl-ACP methyl ester carboxylesterase